MKKKFGFTLVELLVVISIIAMLIAIMVPILARSRLLGNRLTCLNNLKQLGIAVETYAMSCKYYPVCVSETDVKWSDFLADKTVANGKMLGVPVSLWPFYLNANLYNCPILSKAGADISYCYNYLAGKKYEIGEPKFASIAPSYIPPKPKPTDEQNSFELVAPEKVKAPAMFIILYDLPDKAALEEKNPASLFFYEDIDPDDYPAVGKNIDPVQGFLWDANMVGPHSKGYDILFGDGHSKLQRKWSNSDMSRSPK